MPGSECHKNNYISEPLNDIPGQPATVAASPSACQARCAAVPACAFFTFIASCTLACHLTSAAGRLTASTLQGVAAGPRHCPGRPGTGQPGSRSLLPADVGCQNGRTRGTDYRGDANTTESGRACQRWDSQDHPFQRFFKGEGANHNKCRSPTLNNTVIEFSEELNPASHPSEQGPFKQ